MVHQEQITFDTTGHRQMDDLTDEVATIVERSGITTGIVQIFCVGSTAAVGAVEYPGTDLRAGHVVAQGDDKPVSREDRCVGGMQATGQPQRDPQLLFQIVRTAGEQLVADLASARQFTGQWADKKLTEVLIDAALTASLDSHGVVFA